MSEFLVALLWAAFLSFLLSYLDRHLSLANKLMYTMYAIQGLLTPRTNRHFYGILGKNLLIALAIICVLCAWVLGLARNASQALWR